MLRLLCVLFLVCLPSISSAIELKSNPDEVDVYLVPMADFPEDLAASFAKIISDDMKLWVKASVRMGNLNSLKLAGTNQLISEDIIAKSIPIVRKFGNKGNNTYFIILTTSDINNSSANLRFVFSTHNKEQKISVISLRRLVNYQDDKPVVDELTIFRFYKMMKRAIGEIHLGWQRSTDPQDIMYAPIMGVDDIDSMTLEHHEPIQEPLNLFQKSNI